MQFKITQDIISITELKKHTNGVLQQVHNTKRPVVLTKNGKAEAVLLDASEYEKMTGAFYIMQELAKAEMDIRSDRTEDAKTFFQRFRSEKNI
ncbi:MAG: type II toxin-antitoxin system Phd/YefM family antitoxin [Armatimonadetes bacterium]|nr:type II toxin-antitoxin system Phd/YefM family antitoxin [Armatimonadota bacterium]